MDKLELTKPEAASAALPQPHRPSLLLVDDHIENLVALRAVLEDLELELVSCQSGQEALREVLRQDFALILLDVHMPDMDGFEVASLLRKRKKSAGIPIIFMTASTASELQMFQGYALGAVDYLWKPVVPGVLRSKVMVFVELYLKNLEVQQQAARLLELERQAHARALEDERLRSQAHLESILEAAGEGLFGLTAAGRFSFVNPAGATLLGYAPAELMGLDAHALLHPTGCAAGGCALRLALSQGLAHHGLTESFHRRDGSSFPVDYICTPMSDQGRITGFVVTFQDVSERRSLEAQLLQSQKMEAIGRLAGGVAHDFNNILTLIQGYGELLLEALRAQPEAQASLQVILDAGQRAATLTKQLLLFSRKQPVQPKLLDLNSQIQRLEQMLRRLIGEDVQLQTLLESGLPPTLLDPGHFDQVVMNLAVNARDAMPRGGILGLRTSTVILDTPYLSWHPEMQPGNYVMLTISDSGCGMNAETLERIFEPFYTTKTEGQGTGLGLATVYSIVKQNQGQIFVYSEPNEGTVFKLYFPANSGQAELPEPVEAPAQRVEGHETLLVVEDDPDVRRLICNVLEDSGYRVIQAINGREALELCQNGRQPPDLLLTDVIMPEMSGAELGKLLGESYPALQVLYMSGYTNDLLARHGLAEADVNLLEKPFTPGRLLEKVRQMLAAQS